MRSRRRRVCVRPSSNVRQALLSTRTSTPGRANISPARPTSTCAEARMPRGRYHRGAGLRIRVVRHAQRMPQGAALRRCLLPNAEPLATVSCRQPALVQSRWPASPCADAPGTAPMSLDAPFLGMQLRFARRRGLSGRPDITCFARRRVMQQLLAQSPGGLVRVGKKPPTLRAVICAFPEMPEKRQAQKQKSPAARKLLGLIGGTGGIRTLDEALHPILP